jgi:hypothetical protein
MQHAYWFSKKVAISCQKCGKKTPKIAVVTLTPGCNLCTAYSFLKTVSKVSNDSEMAKSKNFHGGVSRPPGSIEKWEIFRSSKTVRALKIFSVENNMIIYMLIFFPANFFALTCPPISFDQFGEAKLLHPLLSLSSVWMLYKPLYHPLIFSIALDLKLSS